MAVELGAEPYSEAGLVVRNPAHTYFTTVEVVRAAKGQVLDHIFDEQPGYALDDRSDFAFDMVGKLRPESLEVEDEFWRIVKGLEVDGDLNIESHGEGHFPVLTKQSLDRIAEMRKRQVDDQVRAWEQRLS